MKAILLGVNLEHTQQSMRPCLALYNLKLYALKDQELKQAEVKVEILEKVEYTDDDVILKLLCDAKPDVIAASCYLWSTTRLLKIIKAYVADNKNTKVLLGGPDVADLGEEILAKNNFVSAVAYGEGEETFRLFLRRLSGVDKDSWKETPGIVVRKETAYQTNPLPAPLSINDIPITIYDKEFVEKFGKWLYMETARGCKYKCAYCNYNTRNYERRIRSFDETIKAIDALVAIGGRYITFLDAGFNQDKERAKKLLRYILSKNISLADLEINIEDLDDEEIELISKLTSGKGCSGRMGIGLQTTNQVAQKNIYRSYNEPKFRAQIAKLRSLDMDYILDIICGLPGDNYETFKKSYNDAISMSPYSVNIFLLSILPGTRLRAEAEKHGIVYDADSPYRIRYCSTFTKEDITKAIRLLNINNLLTTFNSNSKPFQILCQQAEGVVSPTDLIEDLLSGKWDNRPETSNAEINAWREKCNVEDTITITEKFFNYVFRKIIKKEMPIQFRDICNLQYEMGRINANYVSEPLISSEVRVLNDTDKFALSKNLRLVRLKTDVYETLRTRNLDYNYAPLSEYTMVAYRNRFSMKSLKVTDAIDNILRLCQDQPTLVDIIKMFPSTPREQVVSAVSELVNSGMVVTI